ncbi:hypothetical protein San01_60670 [Streptomyces angustmyceticus]|uniref:Uncharacterized protein n=1 Tax=Streptomyces angustmyceticus TaxID=285578 RepID=A0A5J4LQ07_9ACTN|nr:hypothetical protein San01_60670 [Streptomyces angustmyceticus]
MLSKGVLAALVSRNTLRIHADHVEVVCNCTCSTCKAGTTMVCMSAYESTDTPVAISVIVAPVDGEDVEEPLCDKGNLPW